MDKKNLFYGILFSAIGICMLFAPKFCTNVIIALLGIEGVANGVYNLVYTRKLLPNSSFQYAIIIRGMISIVIGLSAFFFPIIWSKTVFEICKIMIRIFAVYLIVATVLQLFASAKMRDTGIERKKFIQESVISLIGAVVLFIIAAKVGTLVIRIIGIATLLFGAAYIIYGYKNRPIIQEGVEVVDDISGDIEKS